MPRVRVRARGVRSDGIQAGPRDDSVGFGHPNGPCARRPLPWRVDLRDSAAVPASTGLVNLISESAWVRARRDASSFLTSTRGVICVSAATLLPALVAWLWPDVGNGWVLILAVVGLLAGLIIPSVWFLMAAPVRQRDEARQRLLDVTGQAPRRSYPEVKRLVSEHITEGEDFLEKLESSDPAETSAVFNDLIAWNESVTGVLRNYSHNNWLQRYNNATFSDTEPHDAKELREILVRKVNSLRALLDGAT